MPQTLRTASNRRTYGSAAVDRLRFIRHARELGFGIEDIRALLALAATPQQSCHLADSIARKNIAAIDRRISALTRLRGELERMVDECAHGRAADCRVIGVIANHDSCIDGVHERV